MMYTKKKILVEPEICPRCGAGFTCSKSGKCWCFEVLVPEDVREAIVQKHDRCLCPRCLNELAALGNSEEIARKV